jgi:hypothetical protein
VRTPAPNTTPADQKADNSEGKQTKRMFGVVPNFAAVSADPELPALTVRGKFKLATQDSVDYSSFVWAGMLAGQSMALKSYPEFHKGIAGKLLAPTRGAGLAQYGGELGSTAGSCQPQQHHQGVLAGYPPEVSSTEIAKPSSRVN